MSYCSRVYNHRNAHTPDVIQEKPFFSKQNSTKDNAKSQPFFQAKLEINKPGDQYEHEADSVANAVVNKQTQTSVLQQKKISSIQKLSSSKEEDNLSTYDERMKMDKDIQRKSMPVAGGEKEKEKLKGIQKKSGTNTSTAPPQVASRIESSEGKGNALPAKTLSEMNSSFGADFSNVKIHKDNESASMNRELQAEAFTHGKDIYFNSGKYNPENSGGKFLLAHELTHVIQQGDNEQQNVHRSCNDAKCDECIGGTHDFWITFYFRRRANEKTMGIIRKEMNEAKQVLKNCCLNLKAFFDWRLLGGGGTFDPFPENADGTTDFSKYSTDAKNLGNANTFNNSVGLPVLVVDEVLHSGGGATVIEQFNPADYQGRTYAVLGINQPAFFQGCNALAHELWHVAGNLNHDKTQGDTIAECSGNTVNEKYCWDLRNVVAPIGDFPETKSENAYA